MAKFLQINLNHCRAAQDLLMQVIAENNIQMAIISEPCWIPRNKNWVSNNTNRAALFRGRNCPDMINIRRGTGFVTAVVGGVTVCSCYSSPNSGTREFEDWLESMTTALGRTGNAIVSGDFNAKLVIWGNKKTDARGTILEIWALSLNLILQNTGSSPTSVSDIKDLPL